MTKRQTLPAVQTPHMLDFISHSQAQTIRIGQRLGSHMQPGDLLLLHGDLGTGKTQLVRGVAQAFESPDMVTSPSFVLINEYQAGPRWPGMLIYHVDLYRIDNPTDLASIGLEELCNPHDICLVEWAEQADQRLPAEHLTIQLGHLDETKRVLRFVPQGAHYIDLLERFKATAFA